LTIAQVPPQQQTIKGKVTGREPLFHFALLLEFKMQKVKSE